MPESLLLLKLQACNFIKKETLAQVFSCEFCEIFKSTFSTKHLQATASVPVNYAKFLATPFLQNTSGRLLLPCQTSVMKHCRKIPSNVFDRFVNTSLISTEFHIQSLCNSKLPLSCLINCFVKMTCLLIKKCK